MNGYFDLLESNFSPSPPIHKAFIGPDLCEHFSGMLKCTTSECDSIKISNEERRALLSHLLDYYKIHIESFDEIKSREILETVFA